MPGSARYPGTPLHKKLGIKPVHNVALIHAPKDFANTLGELPFGAVAQNGLSGKILFDVIVVFVKQRKELEHQLGQLRNRMNPAAALWIAWPKKASGVVTDMSDHAVREIALPTGLVDNKVCAIDEIWSGLRLVIRLENR